MSTIEKLSIQGVRSFGPHAEDMQSIIFSSPVTLILGENGCGKTTIIECLKYALTGEAPPGSDRGKNFVHDPKIFNLTDTLGQIKLQVRDSRGARLSVCRSMKIANRRGKACFETLDSTINYLNSFDTDKSGKKVESISQRCVDVDTLMCKFMGVSKAIINNVLFCHQEDSSWPLDEAKKLKEKFDAIFGITEYNKAIEKIIKMRKEQSEELRVMDANLKYLSHLKTEMEDKTVSLQNAEKKRDAVKEECQQVDDSVKPIDERLQQIRKIELEVLKYQEQKVELETKQSNCEEQIASLSKKIKTMFEGSLSDLERELHAFDQKMFAKRMERKEVEEHLASLKSQEKGLQKMHTDLDKKRHMCLQQHQKQLECTNQRFDKIKNICQQLDMATPTTMDNINDLLEEVESMLACKQSEISELTAKHEQDDQKQQTAIDTLRVDMTKLEESVVSLQKQKDAYEQESQTNETKIAEIELSANRLKVVLKEFQKVEDLYNATVAKFDQEQCRQTIAASKQRVQQLNEQFHKLDERLTVLSSISKLMAEIAVKEKELERKEQEVRRIKSKHSDNFGKVFPQPVEANYRRALNQAYEKYRRDIKDLNEQANKLKLQEQSCEMKRKNLKDEISKMEKDLEESKETIYQKCHATPYEELLLKSKVTVSKLQLDHGALKSAEAMYKKYIQKISDDVCCPLCHKDMSGNEATDITQELNDEIQQLPTNITRTEKQLKAEQQKYESLLQLKPIIEKVQGLEVDLPKRKEELKKLQATLAECANECESLQMALHEPTEKMELANTMSGDMSLLDEALKEVPRVQKEIEALKRKLPEGHDASVSIEDLQLEKSTIAGELESERKKLDSEQHSYEARMEALNKLREKKNTIKDQQIKLQENLQSLPQLKERQTQLNLLMINTAEEINAQKLKVQPLKQKLNSAIHEKARQKDANRKKITQMQQKFDALKNIDRDIQRLNNEVLDFEKLNLEDELKRLKDSLKNTQNDLNALTEKITNSSEQLDAVKTECLNHESLERDLKDNRELKVLQQKASELKEQREALSKQLGNLDYRTVGREKNELIKQRDAATVRKGELLGQIGEINNQIKKIEREMDEPKYKDSLQNYRRALYEVEVTRLIIDDLGQYRLALEWALMKFHEEKMANINRLIREYWRLIYRGNDIDYIQIKTKADDVATDGASASDRRRNYNYRVVQSKNSMEIEMRGRCSAGQRVLASLIIRMALAETFSTNCGVLALDEPTTNLDRNNIQSLCDALNRIVEDRQLQQNFMLIIITHDEGFISTLGKIDMYNRVARNDECKSIIQRVKIA